MKKCLLIVLSLLAFCNSQLPEIDFGWLSAENLTERNYCGVENPSSKQDCFDDSTQFSYCCYLTNQQTRENACHPISPPDYQVRFRTMSFNSTVYEVDCGIIEGTFGTPCGNTSPTHQYNCTWASNSTNSCCRYYNETLGSYCLWLQTKLDISPFPFLQCNPPPYDHYNKSIYYMTSILFLMLIIIEYSF